MKRAAVSVVLNIAEGLTRGTRKQFAQFLWISQGSLSKTVAGFDLTKSLYPNQDFDHQTIYKSAEILAKKINKPIY